MAFEEYKEVTIGARREESSYWHVLWDGDTVGDIALYVDGWKFSWRAGLKMRADCAAKVLDAANEKATLLNVIRRLTT